MIRKSTAPTLIDVAREAGVSLKTASRVLNNSLELNPATAMRVREAMARLEYRPNELARGLKARRSAAIGMIVPNLADPFTASTLQAVQTVARARGYAVIFASSSGDESLEKAELDLLVRRQIEGLIVAPALGKKNYFRSIVGTRLPIVAFDQFVSDRSIDCVTVNNREAARTAVEHLLAHGKRRVLAVGVRPDIYTCVERVAGYCEAMAAKKLTERVLLVEHERDLTPEAIAKLLGKKEAPDAIFSLNWVASMGALRALRELHGFGNLAFISFDDFELAEMLSPALTVVRQPSAEMGRIAAELLFERLTGGRTMRKNVVLSTEFHIRQSCGCD